jgi:transposase
MVSIAEKIGCPTESLRKWVRQAERDHRRRPGLTTEERDRLKALEGANRERCRANEILAQRLGSKARQERRAGWQSTPVPPLQSYSPRGRLAPTSWPFGPDWHRPRPPGVGAPCRACPAHPRSNGRFACPSAPRGTRLDSRQEKAAVPSPRSGTRSPATGRRSVRRRDTSHCCRTAESAYRRTLRCGSGCRSEDSGGNCFRRSGNCARCCAQLPTDSVSPVGLQNNKKASA